MPKARVCIDCVAEGIVTKRNAKYPGPRCTSHNRAIKKARSSSQWEVRIQATYNITPEDYWLIYEHQGGRCYICQRATGKIRRLSIDHDHSCCKGSTSCGKCVRGLLCKSCNTMLGFQRDDVHAFQRAIDYLEYPPAQEVLK